jgi:hypothetical protein
MPACSILGKPGVEIAPYTVSQTDENIEIRHYKELVLVSTSMGNEMDDNSGAFNKLFRYISGDNTDANKIDMTAPVLMDSAESEGQKIAMTAPVIMEQDDSAKGWTMSFVLPKQFTYDTAPRPTNPDVRLERITNLKAAAITFNGRLNTKNVNKHRRQLEEWIASNDYVAKGPYKTAGYNPPWTLPSMRRNEVLIPVEAE